MLKTNLIALLIFSFFNCTFAQQRSLVEYDILTQTYDTLSLVEFDTSEVAAQTDYFIGNFDGNIALLEEITPADNLFENTNFTRKQLTRDYYTLTDYPIRTSVKLFYVENDTLKNWCSGSMVSNQHVLTAAHCMLDLMTNEIFDSILVCPIYDNGAFNDNFECAYVNKYYFFEDWRVGDTDIGLLKLDQPIGTETGWIGIGYDEGIEEAQDEIFYKFSYPSRTLLFVDSMEYNGNDLYFNYGNIDFLGDDLIGIYGTNGIPGESGSSLIQIQNNFAYTTYGALSFSTNLNHCRLTDWKYHAFADVLQSSLTSINSTLESKSPILYPNPVQNVVFIKNIDYQTLQYASIYDVVGRLIQDVNLNILEDGINISKLSNGTYFLKLQQGDSSEILRFIKTE